MSRDETAGGEPRIRVLGRPPTVSPSPVRHPPPLLFGVEYPPRRTVMATPEQGRIERRLTAILAADIAGYSRLMGADEIGTARALREHRAAIDPMVASHGGRIVKTTGDGILLEFPSIVAAVECAAAVQRLMALMFRSISGCYSESASTLVTC
jgi:hypothetical protein